MQDFRKILFLVFVTAVAIMPIGSARTFTYHGDRWHSTPWTMSNAPILKLEQDVKVASDIKGVEIATAEFRTQYLANPKDSNALFKWFYGAFSGDNYRVSNNNEASYPMEISGLVQSEEVQRLLFLEDCDSTLPNEALAKRLLVRHPNDPRILFGCYLGEIEKRRFPYNVNQLSPQVEKLYVLALNNPNDKWMWRMLASAATSVWTDTNELRFKQIARLAVKHERSLPGLSAGEVQSLKYNVDDLDSGLVLSPHHVWVKRKMYEGWLHNQQRH